MSTTPLTTGARAVTVAVVALLLGACSSTSTDTTAAAPSTSGPGVAATSPAVVGTTVGVVEKDFSITLDKPGLTAGSYTFAIKNEGQFPHNLAIEGPGVDAKTSPTMQGGGSGTLAVTLQKGTYELWCAVPGHKDRGMDIKITVT